MSLMPERKSDKEKRKIMYVEVKNVTKRIDGNVVLENITCSFEQGMIYGIRGKNGSGKTMLLKAISGLVRIDEGEIIVGGQLLKKGNEFPEDVSALIENPGFIGNYSGLRNLEILAKIRNRISQETIVSYMERFQLEPFSKKKVKKYSLGMKQKLGIIAALMESSKLILLDEPTNALDEESVRIFNEMLLEEKKKGNTIIITSHDFDELKNMADCIIEMSNGKKANVSTFA
jgi:ABC-2 type transport system ATP-binding protein